MSKHSELYTTSLESYNIMDLELNAMQSHVAYSVQLR